MPAPALSETGRSGYAHNNTYSFQSELNIISMKRELLLALLMLPAAGMLAAERTPADVAGIARRHFAVQAHGKAAQSHPVMVAKASSVIKDSAALTADYEPFYVYSSGDDNFVIISGDDRLPEVLAYSDDAAFPTENIPANLGWILSGYSQIAAAESAAGQAAQGARELHRTSVYQAGEYKPSVEPLLEDVAWDQGAPYNDLCPDHTVTGCVATAMAQIMKYYQYPKIGNGRVSYFSKSLGLSCTHDFEAKAIDWGNMLPRYENAGYTMVQGNAVAELMKACGMAVKMDYGYDTSSASALMVTEALTKYFKYDKGISFRMRNAYPNADWINMLKTELSESRPVLYNGASKSMGHEFVLDGYDSEGLFHVNWGWSGLANGYFNINVLDPLETGIGGGETGAGGYIYSQGAVIGIRPDTKQGKTVSNWYMTALLLLSELDSKGALIGDNISLGVVAGANYGPTFFGDLGIELVRDTDGGSVGIMTSRQVGSVEPGMGGNMQFDFTLPADIGNGIYRLYFVAREAHSSVWERVRPIVGYTPFYAIRVTDGKVEFADPREMPVLAGDMTVNGGITINKQGSFTVNVKNNGNKYYYGRVGVAVAKSQASNAPASFYTDEVRLDPGEETTVDITAPIVNSENTPIEKGEAYICGVFSFGEAIFQLTDFSKVTVEEAKAPKIELIGELAPEPLRFPQNEEFRLPLTVKCEGDYDQYIVAAIFPNHAQQTSITVGLKVDLKDGEEQSLVLHDYIRPMLPMGSHFVGVYYYDITTGVYSGEIGFADFEVTEPTGVENLETGSGHKAYPSVVDDIFHIENPGAIDTVEIFDIGGRRVGCYKAGGSSSIDPVSYTHLTLPTT